MARLSVPITTTPAPGTVETYNVDAAAPPWLRADPQGNPGGFAAVMNDEVVFVQAGPSGGNPWRFTRGAEPGSVIEAHAAGTEILHIPTAGALYRMLANLEDYATQQAIVMALALGR